jgi:hypothetical protein
MQIINVVVNEKEYFCSKEEKEHRQSVCDTCDKNVAGFCKECLCLLVSKTAYRNTDCPLGKWNVGTL